MGEGGDWGDVQWSSQLEPVDWDERRLQEFTRVFLEMPDKEDPEAEKEREKLAIQVHEHTGMRFLPSPASTFKELGIPEYALKGLREHRMTSPNPFQAQSMPLVLRGVDLCGSAPPQTGKTFSYLVPAVVHIEATQASREKRADKATPTALILAPSREQAQNIEMHAKMVLRHSKEGRHKDSGGIWCACIADSVKRQDTRSLTCSAHVVVAVPSRLVEFLRSKVVSLERVTYMVVDNVDHMFEDKQVGALLAVSGQVRPDRQTQVFANDWGKDVEQLARKLFVRRSAPFARISCRMAAGDRTEIDDDRIRQFVSNLNGREGLEHEVIVTDIPDREDREQQEQRILKKERHLLDHLKRILSERKDNKALVFVGERAYADHVAARLRELRDARSAACAFHGGKVQESRLWMLEQFTKGELRVMVATDVVGRNIEVPGVSHVVLYEVGSLEEYVTKVCRPPPIRDGAHVLVFFEQDESNPHQEPTLAPDLVAFLEALRQRVPDDLRRVAKEVAEHQRRPMFPDMGASGALAKGRSCSSTRSPSRGRQEAPPDHVPTLVRRSEKSKAARGASSESTPSSGTCLSPDRREVERRRLDRGKRQPSARRNVPQRRRYAGRSRDASARRGTQTEQRKSSTAAPSGRRRRSKAVKSSSAQAAASGERGPSVAGRNRTRTRSRSREVRDAASKAAQEAVEAALRSAASAQPKRGAPPPGSAVPGAGAKARPSLPAAKRRAREDSPDSNVTQTPGDDDEESTSDVSSHKGGRGAGTPGKPGPTNSLVPKAGESPGPPAGPPMPTPKAAAMEDRKSKLPKPLPQPQAKKPALPAPKEKERPRLPGQTADKGAAGLSQPLAAAAQQARNAARAERALDGNDAGETASKTHHRHEEADAPKEKGAGEGKSGPGSLPQPPPGLPRAPTQDVFAQAGERVARLGDLGLRAQRHEAEQIERDRAELDQKRASLIDWEAQVARRERECRQHEENKPTGIDQKAILLEERQRHAHQAAKERADNAKEKARLEVQAERDKNQMEEAKRKHREEMEEALAELEKQKAALLAQQKSTLERVQATQAKDQQEAQTKLDQRQAALDSKEVDLAGREGALNARKLEVEKKESMVKAGVKKLELRFLQEKEWQAVHREDVEALQRRHREDRASLSHQREQLRIATEKVQAELQKAHADKLTCEAQTAEIRRQIIQNCEEAEKKVAADRQQIEEAENKVAADHREVEKARLESMAFATEQQLSLTSEREQVERSREVVASEVKKMQAFQEAMDSRQKELDLREAQISQQAQTLVQRLEEAKAVENAKTQQEADEALRRQRELLADERKKISELREEADRRAAAARAEAETVRRERQQVDQDKEDVKRETRDAKKEKKQLSQERQRLEDLQRELERQEEDVHKSEASSRSLRDEREALEKERREDRRQALAAERTYDEREETLSTLQQNVAREQEVLEKRRRELNALLQQVLRRERETLRREKAVGADGPLLAAAGAASQDRAQTTAAAAVLEKPRVAPKVAPGAAAKSGARGAHGRKRERDRGVASDASNGRAQVRARSGSRSSESKASQRLAKSKKSKTK